jgi:SMC interacting uncharacterized protein involved in chromosome segregation
MAATRTLEQLDNIVRQMQSDIGDIQSDIRQNTTDIKGKASKALLTTEVTRLTDTITEVTEELTVVSRKLSTIFEPDETIAYIGADELRTMRLRITQLESLRNEIQTMSQTVTDMVTSWDEAQTGVIP